MINCRVLPPTTCNFCATYGNYIMHTSKMLMSHALINPIAGHFVQTLMTFFPVNLFNTSILYIKTTYKCPLSLPLLCHHPIHSHQVLSRQARIKKKELCSSNNYAIVRATATMRRSKWRKTRIIHYIHFSIRINNICIRLSAQTLHYKCTKRTPKLLIDTKGIWNTLNVTATQGAAPSYNTHCNWNVNCMFSNNI